VNLFRSYLQKGDVKINIESTRISPIAGKHACYGLGRGLALIEGICAGMGIPYQLVEPKTWQGYLFKGLSGSTKQKSLQFVKRAYPNLDIRKSNLAKKDHDGKADAVCIGYYGWR